MRKRKKKLSLFFKVSLLVFIICGLLLLLSRTIPELSEWLNSTASQSFRSFMASFGELFSFSLFEVILLLLPLVLLAVIISFVISVKRGRGLLRPIANLLSVLMLLLSGNALALGVAYNSESLSEKMELSSVEVNADTLSDTLNVLIDELNETAPLVSRDDGGVAMMGCSLEELSVRICDSYIETAEEYGLYDGFYSTAKSVDALNILSRLGITGIYTFYTGEANVNTDYPDYDVAFTAAHELSHQRGILRENEANFSAYIICSSSDDVFLRYSAALYMYEYVASALYRTDSERYYSETERLTELVNADIKSSRAVTEKYGGGILNEISDFVNDMFLKSNGTAGTVTYGMVVELTVAYIADSR